MLEIVRKYRFHVVAGVSIFLALILFSLSLRQRDHAGPLERALLGLTSPIHYLAGSASKSVARVWEDYFALVEVRRDNRRLLEVIRQQNERLLQANESVMQNERLTALLDMKKKIPARSMPASVIGEDASAWFRTLVIDRGEADGIRDGMPVVAATGIVGQIVKTTTHSARVLLLTDHAGAVAGVVQRSRARGVVKGQGGDICVLDFTLREDDVKVGDQIMTSGIGGVFPKGLPVGEVIMVKKGPYGIFQTVHLRPAVNLTTLEEVLVVLTAPHD